MKRFRELPRNLVVAGVIVISLCCQVYAQRAKIVPIRKFSGDGKRFVQSGIEGRHSVQVFDVASGKNLFSRDEPDALRLGCEINHDGSLISVYNGKFLTGLTRIIDVESGRIIFTSNSFGKAAFSNNGKWLALGNQFLGLDGRQVVSCNTISSVGEKEELSFLKYPFFSNDSQKCVFISETNKQIMIESIDTNKLGSDLGLHNYKSAVTNSWVLDGNLKRFESCLLDPSSRYLGVHVSVRNTDKPHVSGELKIFRLSSTPSETSKVKTIPHHAPERAALTGQSYAFVAGQSGTSVITVEEKHLDPNDRFSTFRERTFEGKLWHLENVEIEQQLVFRRSVDAPVTSVFPRVFCDASDERILFVLPNGKRSCRKRDYGPAKSYLMNLRSKQIVAEFASSAHMDKSGARIITQGEDGMQIYSASDGAFQKKF